MSFLLAVAAFALSPQDKPEAVDYVKTWSQATKAIQGRYYDREKRAKWIEEKFKEHGPKATGAKSKEEFSTIMNNLIGEFKDSHFAFLSDEDQGYYLMDGLANSEGTPMPGFGAWFRKVGDSYTVQMVLNGGSAEKAGIMKGDVVVSIDGKPFTPVTSLQDEVDKKASLRIRRGSTEIEKQVEVEKKPALQMFLDATTDSERIIDLKGKKVGYIHLWTQGTDKFKNALFAAIDGKFKNTDAMILDLRDGFGGRPEGYGDPFFRPDVDLVWKFGAKQQLDQKFGYGKPLVVLINGGSRSAKEVLSFVFKKSKRATLVGSNTAGNVLGTSPARLNGWAYLEIPMVEVIADGVRLEGVGVAPDVKVDREFDESGKDLYIEKALEVLSKKV